MSDGKGCKCAARSAADCGCDGVDWRSGREIAMELALKVIHTWASYVNERGERPAFTADRICKLCADTLGMEENRGQ